MKKIFSIMAVAMVVLSLASCKGKNTPDDPKDVTFAISVSEITAASAFVTVTPSDTNAYYYFDLLTAADLEAGYNEDSLAALIKESVEYHKEQFPYYLSKGVDEWNFNGLMPETEYIAYALQFDSTYTPVGKWTTKSFKTPEMEIKETVKISGEGELVDYISLMGAFAVYADINDKGAYLDLTIAADSLEGKFTEEDLDEYFGGWAVIDEQNEEYYPVISLAAEGKLNADETEYAFKGEAVCTNGVKYVLDLVCPVEELDWEDLFGDDYDAPARRIGKAHKAPKHFGRK